MTDAYTCAHCHPAILGKMYGAGDGGGQRFACPECHWRNEALAAGERVAVLERIAIQHHDRARAAEARVKEQERATAHALGYLAETSGKLSDRLQAGRESERERADNAEAMLHAAMNEGRILAARLSRAEAERDSWHSAYLKGDAEATAKLKALEEEQEEAAARSFVPTPASPERAAPAGPREPPHCNACLSHGLVHGEMLPWPFPCPTCKGSSNPEALAKWEAGWNKAEAAAKAAAASQPEPAALPRWPTSPPASEVRGPSGSSIPGAYETPTSPPASALPRQGARPIALTIPFCTKCGATGGEPHRGECLPASPICTDPECELPTLRHEHLAAAPTAGAEEPQREAPPEFYRRTHEPSDICSRCGASTGEQHCGESDAFRRAAALVRASRMTTGNSEKRQHVEIFAKLVAGEIEALALVPLTSAEEKPDAT